MIRTIVVLCAAIVALDAVEALIARSAGVSYAWFMLVQILVYIAIGFALRRRGATVPQLLIAVAVTGVVEATLGEWVAVAMRATPAVPLAQYVFVVPVVIVVECALAFGGFALASVGRTARS